MNGEQEAASDQADVAAPAPSEIFRCKQCGQEFGTDRGLQTHVIRAHRQFWTTNKKSPGLTSPPTRRKPARNATYVKYRDRYKAMGLNTKGKPYKRQGNRRQPYQGPAIKCPVCNKKVSNPGSLGNHMKMTHGQSLKQFRNGQKPRRGLGMSATAALRLPKTGGRPRAPGGLKGRTCPVCKKRFATRPGMTLHLRKVHGKSITEFDGTSGRAPVPNEQPNERPAPKPKPEGREIIFCPVCGTNIHAVRTAVNFAEQ